jgi:hypothetical protein
MIEDLDLKNIVEIERYLDDEMGEEEKAYFLQRIMVDKELMADFSMVVETFQRPPAKRPRKYFRNIKEQNLQKYLSVRSMQRYTLPITMFLVGLSTFCAVALALV